MNRRHDSRARRTALAAGAVAVSLWASFGASVHADDDPVADPPPEAGDVGGAIVAVGLPPVPPTSVVVAVGLPPVPPTSVVVAVGPPPVPPTSVVVAVGPPPVPPKQAPVAAADRPVPANPRVHPQADRVGQPAVAGLRSVEVGADRLTDVIADVIASVDAALAMIDSRL